MAVKDDVDADVNESSVENGLLTSSPSSCSSLAAREFEPEEDERRMSLASKLSLLRGSALSGRPPPSVKIDTSVPSSGEPRE